MATHTPAQAIQELVNHTAVLTERLVGLQTEVRKGMNMTPEWNNALTQLVGDTKRMLSAMEHLARLPAFHLDRDGLNAAVAAGVQRGLAAGGGESLVALIENNSRQLEEAKTELAESKARMDKMLEEIQTTKSMDPESRQRFFMQFAPVVGVWSVGLLLAGLMVGRSCTRAPEAVVVAPAAVSQQAAKSQVGAQAQLPLPGRIYDGPDGAGKPFMRAPAGMTVTVLGYSPGNWINVSFPVAAGKTEKGWLQPGSLP
jgi:hypothetical protein